MWNNCIKEDSITYTVLSVCIATTFQRSYTNLCLHIPINAFIVWLEVSPYYLHNY